MFSSTKLFSSYVCMNLCPSALWQGRQSVPGYSSKSPVFTLKQEPCHGQRTLWPDSTPAEEHETPTVVTLHFWHVIYIQTEVSCTKLDLHWQNWFVMHYLCSVEHHNVCIGYWWHCTSRHSVPAKHCAHQPQPPSF